MWLGEEIRNYISLNAGTLKPINLAALLGRGGGTTVLQILEYMKFFLFLMLLIFYF